VGGDKTIGSTALRRIGGALRGLYDVPSKLPYRLFRLLSQLKRQTDADAYRQHAAEAMRLAQEAPPSSRKMRLMRLAEDWLRLADKVREERPQEPAVLHPLIQKKLGDPPE
jgi:hypothetical protein